MQFELNFYICFNFGKCLIIFNLNINEHTIFLEKKTNAIETINSK